MGDPSDAKATRRKLLRGAISAAATLAVAEVGTLLKGATSARRAGAEERLPADNEVLRL